MVENHRPARHPTTCTASRTTSRWCATFLHDNGADLALVIINATQIERQMSLVAAAKAAQHDLVVLLNMADEARKYGITSTAGKCPSCWAWPIFLLSANMAPAIRKLCRQSQGVAYPTPGMGTTAHQLEQDVHIETRWRACSTRRADTGATAGKPHRKLDGVMAAPVAGAADLFFAIMYLCPGMLPARPTPANRRCLDVRLVARGRACAAAGRLPASRARHAARWVYNGVATVAAFVAAHRAVLPVHGDGGRQRLPVARRVPDGRADGALGWTGAFRHAC